MIQPKQFVQFSPKCGPKPPQYLEAEALDTNEKSTAHWEQVMTLMDQEAVALRDLQWRTNALHTGRAARSYRSLQRVRPH